ncbi:MAG: ABC transporter substrate-binding protein [Lachnospiraceae bacterium]|nr:ABC transporter substrate-binding protein [Lachnospiraceae bacterium]
MKKILSLILVTILAVSMAACGSSGSQSAAEEPAKESSAEAAATEAPAAESTEPAETEAPAAESSEAEAEPAEAAEPFVTITDMTGREISLDEPATRIVALSAADCEVLYAIGGGDALVGRGEYCDYPAEVLDVPSVQSGYDTNIEQIISLEPQVLLMSTMAQTEEQIAALEAAGIRVVVSDAQDIEGVYTSIDMIGKLMGKEDNAKAVIDGMKSTFDGLKANAGDGTKTVYFEVSPLEYGLWTAGKNTFMNEISEMIGLKNVFDDVDGWAEISEEQVIERNPDYIVTITMYFGEGPTPVEEILSRPGWGEITAVKNEAVLNLVNNELSRPTPRLAEGAQMLYDFVYAEEALDNAA